MSAVISDCGRYRYALKRDIQALGNEGTVLFVMLNPSTADASVDDATVRRCIGFAERWGYARLTVANLYGLRATDPRELVAADDPVGPENDEWLMRLSRQATEVIVAWGADRMAKARSQRTLDLIEVGYGYGIGPSCLGQTKNLSPKHPLYLRANTPRQVLKVRAASLPTEQSA